MQLDYEGFVLINHLAQSLSFLNPMMRLFAQQGEYMFYAAILVYWFSRSIRNRTQVLEALLAACAAMGISAMLSHFLYRDRPFVTHDVLQLIQHAPNASFPSDHATAAFALATMFWLYRRHSGKLWLILAACIAVSRVWTGVHYPADVLAGACIGALSAGGVHRIATKTRWAERSLDAVIRYYEKMENKVWPNKQTTRSLDS